RRLAAARGADERGDPPVLHVHRDVVEDVVVAVAQVQLLDDDLGLPGLRGGRVLGANLGLDAQAGVAGGGGALFLGHGHDLSQKAPVLYFSRRRLRTTIAVRLRATTMSSRKMVVV